MYLHEYRIPESHEYRLVIHLCSSSEDICYPFCLTVIAIRGNYFRIYKEFTSAGRFLQMLPVVFRLFQKEDEHDAEEPRG